MAMAVSRLLRFAAVKENYQVSVDLVCCRSCQPEENFKIHCGWWHSVGSNRRRRIIIAKKNQLCLSRMWLPPAQISRALSQLFSLVLFLKKRLRVQGGENACVSLTGESLNQLN